MFPRTATRSFLSLLPCALVPVAIASCGSPESPGTSEQAAVAASSGRQQLHGYLTPAITATKLVGPVPAQTIIHLAIGLPVRNPQALQALIAQVTNPASPSYRKYLSPEQFTATYAPTATDYRTVEAFAKANGLTVASTYSNQLLLDVSGPAAAVQKTFGVNLNYRLRPDGTTFYALDREPSVALSVPLLHVTGLENLVTPRALGGSAPNGWYGSSDVRAAYASCTGLTGAGQSVGLLEFDGYNASDVQKYESLLGLPNVPLVNVLLHGATGVPKGDNAEAVADVELPIAMAPGLASVVVFEAPSPSSVSIEIAYANDLLNAMATHLPLIRQLSSSYTFQMDATTQQIFDTMAAQGQSFFQSSGDGGSYLMNTQWNINAANITLVGGTTLSMNGSGASYQSEVSWSSGSLSSGGGVECCEPNVPIPTYQQGIDMTANHGSTTSRNSPDVSMVADGLFIVATAPTPGGWFSFYGTSAAAPLWAGYMALANEQSQLNGLNPVGFANPALYAAAKKAYSTTFNDVTSGTNGGFSAVTGYDLVTGLGTPKCALIDQLACVTCGGSTCVDLQGDSNNCGSCGNVCPGGGTCTKGLCGTLATGSANDLAVDGTSVYWTSWTGGTVMKVPVGGGAPTTLASGQSFGGGFAVDATTAYWGTLGIVRDVPLAGGAAGTLASGLVNGPLDVAVDGADVFWMANGAKESLCTSTVAELAKVSGSTPTTLAGSCGGVRMATDGTSVFWTTQGSPMGGPTGTPAAVMQVAVTAGATPLQLASGGSPSDVVVYGGKVYWVDGASIKVVPVGGGAVQVLTSAGGAPRSIAVDGSGIYWTSTTGPSGVLTMPLAGGTPATLASSSSPDRIAVTANRVYWTDHALGVEQRAK